MLPGDLRGATLADPGRSPTRVSRLLLLLTPRSAVVYYFILVAIFIASPQLVRCGGAAERSGAWRAAAAAATRRGADRTHPRMPLQAYNFSELIESHAIDTYGEMRGGAQGTGEGSRRAQEAPTPPSSPCARTPSAGEFCDANEELLKSMPPPLVALQYYRGGDVYMCVCGASGGGPQGGRAGALPLRPCGPGVLLLLQLPAGVLRVHRRRHTTQQRRFDEFQTSRRAEPRPPQCDNLYDVFINIRRVGGRTACFLSWAQRRAPPSPQWCLASDWRLTGVCGGPPACLCVRVRRDDEGEHVKTMKACQVRARARSHARARALALPACCALRAEPPGAGGGVLLPTVCRASQDLSVVDELAERKEKPRRV